MPSRHAAGPVVAARPATAMAWARSAAPRQGSASWRRAHGRSSGSSGCVARAAGSASSASGIASPADAGAAVAAAAAPPLLMWERQMPRGRLLVRPIASDEAQAASVVLTRAFAASAEAVRLADVLSEIEALSRDDDAAATSAAAALPPPLTARQGVFLVARMYPTDPTTLPAGKDSRLIGTASLSLSPGALPMRRLPAANPPPQGVGYISNMAVDPSFRRAGVARALLRACEEAAAGAGRAEVWLHVREADGPARALYDGAGYEAMGKDSWLDATRCGIRPRILMRRRL